MANIKRSNLWVKVISIAMAFMGVFGLLGAFRITKIGSGIFSVFELILGNFDWAGPFIALVLAFFLWPSSRRVPNHNQRGSTKKNSVIKGTSSKKKQKHMVNEGRNISIPGGKLVTLKGFEKYFSSPDWPELNSENTAQERMSELGQDFSTYFGEGQKLIPKLPPKLMALQGMKKYFSSVDLEFSEEVHETVFPIKTFSKNKHVFKEKTDDIFFRSSDSEKVAESDNENLAKEPELQFESAPFQEVKPDLVQMAEEQEMESPPNGGIAFIESDLIQVRDNDLSIREIASAQGLSDVNIDLEQKLHFNKQRWQLPNFDLLDTSELLIKESIPDKSPQQLEGLLKDFGIKAKVIRVHKGPVITRYELAPAPGVKISRIVSLADDIALSLAAKDVRIEAPIPGKSAIGIEVPNKEPQIVGFKEVLETSFFEENSSLLKVALGKDIGGQPVVGDLGKMPHLLVAGATGAGKSVCISTIINSILYNATPAQVKFLLIDPKMVELSLYNGIPHLVAPVITDSKRAAAALKWLVKEMETRYELFAQTGVRDIERYNRLQSGGHDTPSLPLIVVIIDELADLMLVAGEVEETICRLAQMARAAGIHLVLATQRPSVDVITGLIKANIPSRIAFAVSSQIDSRTILDCTGAEKLMGRGDMLFSPQGLNKPLRVQGCLVKDEEVQRIIKFWRKQGQPEYLEIDYAYSENTARTVDMGEDDLFEEAARLLINSGMASVSFLQRRLKIGYARAARLMDMLEEQGIVGGYEGSRPRQILISITEFEEKFG